MKYLKTFENKKTKFKVGDYVVATDCSYLINFALKSLNIKIRDSYNKLKIILENSVGIIEDVDEFDQYYIKYYIPKNINLYSREIITFRFSEKEKLRLATPEEIKDYKMKENERKYNL